MINNLEYIKKHLTFTNDRSFYFIQILKRKKENPEMKSYSRPIESFYVFSKEQLDRMMPHIIEKCEQNRARAYIKMNCLDAQSVLLEQISVISREIRNQNWKHLASTLNSGCGICGKQDGTEKLYLVDIDSKDESEISQIKECIENLKPIKYNEIDEYGHTLKERIFKVKMTVPTQNGVHLLTTGFDIQSFKKEYPNIDIHEDGITLLYFPNI